MGQYYKPAMIENKNAIEWLYSHDFKTRYKREDGKVVYFGQGLKLMEHSWMKNSFVRAVETLLIPNGSWHKKPIVWAGDYADEEKETGINIYGMCDGERQDGEGISIKLKPKPLTEANAKKFRYIVNHSKKEFVDKREVPSKDGWVIHPLPLLTCEGNGRGGGDFRGNEVELVGRWSRDIISIEEGIPEGYNRIKFDLTE